MSTALSSPTEKGPSGVKSMEMSRLVVRQPGKLQELTNLLETFENLNARVSERTGEDASRDLGGAGTGGATGQQGSSGTSARDLALQNLPAPALMKDRLKTHIQKETKKLERLAKRASRDTSPGSAHRLNALYAKIRQMNALLYDIFSASVDVLKRLFVRVFIDNQPIL